MILWPGRVSEGVVGFDELARAEGTRIGGGGIPWWRWKNTVYGWMDRSGCASMHDWTSWVWGKLTTWWAIDAAQYVAKHRANNPEVQQSVNQWIIQFMSATEQPRMRYPDVVMFHSRVDRCCSS